MEKVKCKNFSKCEQMMLKYHLSKGKYAYRKSSQYQRIFHDVQCYNLWRSKNKKTKFERRKVYLKDNSFLEELERKDIAMKNIMARKSII